MVLAMEIKELRAVQWFVLYLLIYIYFSFSFEKGEIGVGQFLSAVSVLTKGGVKMAFYTIASYVLAIVSLCCNYKKKSVNK